MITLYGVTEDGTTVPVQVTEDGKLVAQGLQGEPGPPGEDGKDSQVPGPPGSPGESGITAVNEPTEGDYLQYKGGTVVWRAGPNIPEPAPDVHLYTEKGPGDRPEEMKLFHSDGPWDDIKPGDYITLCDILGEFLQPEYTAYTYGDAQVGNQWALTCIKNDNFRYSSYIKVNRNPSKTVDTTDVVLPDE